jgi:2-oxoglutarate ferredoxin oxidoreductase subunit beta
VLRAAAAHEGTALVEIYQNCNIFNDGAFEGLKNPETRDEWTIRLEHGKPITFGEEGKHGVMRSPDATLQIVEVADVGEDALLVHDAHASDPSAAFALAHLADIVSLERTPIGVFRDVQRPTYDALMAGQIAKATETSGAGSLQALIEGNDTWTIA